MISKENILEIVEQAGAVSVSIYLPTHKKGEGVQQDSIRLKNMLREIEKEMSRSGLKATEIDPLLEEPGKLLDRPLFWQHNDNSLAMFITEDFFRLYRLPLDLDSRYLVDDTFLITPLLPMISLEGTFCILALSQGEVRLFKATRDTAERIELEESPSSMEDFQKYDVYEKSLSSASGGGGTRSMFHGWGDASIESKAVENYLKTIENEVTSIMRKRNDPLILAGMDEAVALYRKVNHYNRLMEESVRGNPDPKGGEQLRDEGWEVIRSFFLQDMYHDMERFGDLTGTGMRSEEINAIVEGAIHGRIETLFIPEGELAWGWYDEENDTVQRGRDRESPAHDLVNQAAILTLTQGGDVYVLNREEMPNGSHLAAIFRYSNS